MRQLPTRACLKKAFCKMCVTICGRFCPDEGVVAGYDNRIRAKYTAKWGVQIAGMLFQTRSSRTDLQAVLLVIFRGLWKNHSCFFTSCFLRTSFGDSP